MTEPDGYVVYQDRLYKVAVVHKESCTYMMAAKFLDPDDNDKRNFIAGLKTAQKAMEVAQGTGYRPRACKTCRP